MKGRQTWLGAAALTLLMAVAVCLALRGWSLSDLMAVYRQLRPGFLLLGLGLMLVFVCCEALCTRQILARLGHNAPLVRCLGYSFVGFFVSSVTPSATGGQPAQVWCMSRDGVPAGHGALNMLLIAVCYQTATLLCGLGAWLLPGLRGYAGTGMRLLLLYGGGMMALLTLGMGMMMLLPAAVRRVTDGGVRLLATAGLLKRPDAVREKLARQLEQYAQGAGYIRQHPVLLLRLLALCLVQAAALCSVPYLIYLAFGLTGASYWALAGMQAILTLAVCNLPLPGGAGAAEGGFLAVFLPFFGPGLVAPAMLAARCVSFYAFLLVSGGVALWVYLRPSRRHLRPLPQGASPLKPRKLFVKS